MNTPLVRHASQVLAGVPEVRCRYHLSEACHGFGWDFPDRITPGKGRLVLLFFGGEGGPNAMENPPPF